MSERIQASWLSTRREADTEAREASLPLVEELAEHLVSSVVHGDDPHIVDIGAGTGANAEWLAPRLHQALVKAGASRPSQHWHLVDHDQTLLDARRLLLPDEHCRVSDHLGTTADIALLLQGIEGAVLLTCSALLDLLTPTEIDALATDAVTGADAALFALSVTGVITIIPGDNDDRRVSELFNDHQQQPQQRAGASLGAAAGPAGWQLARSAFQAAGWSVHVAQTPWHLGPHHVSLSGRLLAERAEAAAQMADDAPGRAQVHAWLARRERQLAGSGLTIWVDHRDFLALPPRSTSVQMSSPRG